MPTTDPSLMLLPSPHPSVVARALPDGSVLFHAETEVYFGLNETGTVIWEALQQHDATEATLVETVLARWPAQARADVLCHVRELLADLSVEGLVVDAAPTQG